MISFLKCNPRFPVGVDEDRCVCYKSNDLSLDHPPENFRGKYMQLSNDLTMKSLRGLEKHGAEKCDKECKIMKSFKVNMRIFIQYAILNQ